VALRTYLDGAGKEDDHPVITVGGFMAESDICEAIEVDWEAATEGKLFHLADFGTSNCELGSRKWDENRRSDFLRRLAAIVNRPEVCILSGSLEVGPFLDTLLDIENPHEVGPAFSGCAYGVIATAEWQLIESGRRSVNMRYVFEKGDREHEIAAVFADLEKKDSGFFGRRGHGFEPKETTLLQPADFVVGIVQRCLIKAYSGLPCLDNGSTQVHLNTFERSYSPDGVTHGLVNGHDKKTCRIFNARNFRYLDEMNKLYYEQNPGELEKRKKRLTYRPKPKKVKKR
jgi:hypothetical protein